MPQQYNLYLYNCVPDFICISDRMVRAFTLSGVHQILTVRSQLEGGKNGKSLSSCPGNPIGSHLHKGHA